MMRSPFTRFGSGKGGSLPATAANRVRILYRLTRRRFAPVSRQRRDFVVLLECAREGKTGINVENSIRVGFFSENDPYGLGDDVQIEPQ